MKETKRLIILSFLTSARNFALPFLRFLVFLKSSYLQNKKIADNGRIDNYLLFQFFQCLAFPNDY